MKFPLFIIPLSLLFLLPSCGDSDWEKEVKKDVPEHWYHYSGSSNINSLWDLFTGSDVSLKYASETEEIGQGLHVISYTGVSNYRYPLAENIVKIKTTYGPTWWDSTYMVFDFEENKKYYLDLNQYKEKASMESFISKLKAAKAYPMSKRDREIRLSHIAELKKRYNIVADKWTPKPNPLHSF